jgi:hypothetical protein
VSTLTRSDRDPLTVVLAADPPGVMTPEEFATRIQEWGRGTRCRPAGQGRAVAPLDCRPSLGPLFPLTVPLSVNVIRNTNRGMLTAEAGAAAAS